MSDLVHYHPVRVYYEDTDFSGVVYHASYLRFMERGRTELLRDLGIMQGALFDETARSGSGFAFMVREMAITYLKPAKVDDLLIIATWPGEIRGASIVLHQEVRLDMAVLVRAAVTVVFVAGGKASRIPADLRMKLASRAR